MSESPGVGPAAPDEDAPALDERQLAAAGARRIDWAAQHMPVLGEMAARLAPSRPLAGVTVGACLHLTAETAVLLRLLSSLGASVAACAANPLSTQDGVVEALAEGVPSLYTATGGEDREDYYANIDAVLREVVAAERSLTVDDGCDLVSRLHTNHPEAVQRVLGGTEETASGVVRLRAMEAAGALRYPVVAVNRSATKHLLDNRHGTGQSTLDGILRATNVLLAGRTVVVAGYGDCGKGVASRARGMGARVIVTEVSALRALEAAMDGLAVLPMTEAAALGDVFVTVTGNRDVLSAEHFAVMRDGAILANAGHFDIEIDLPALVRMAEGRRRQVRPMVEEYELAPGGGGAGAGARRLYLVAEGRVVNLAAGEGHPAAVMDIAFASQALVLSWLAQLPERLAPGVHTIPVRLEDELAAYAVRSLGLQIDQLSDAQQEYLSTWTVGT